MRLGGRLVLGYAAVFCAVILFALPKSAKASVSDAWESAIWSGTTGWILMNCTANGSCATNNFGVNIDGSLNISGWAWSGNVGWVCFGSSCGAGPTPEGGASYAKLDIVTNNVHGWANIVSLGSKGWISLNCAELGCGVGSYKVNANLQTGIVSGFGWNGNNDGSGVGWIDFSTSRIKKKEIICTDGFDNDADGATDCADSDCLGQIGPGGCVCGPEANLATCQNSCDDDGDGLIDCADPNTCTAVPANGCPAIETQCLGGNCCGNDIDDDFDTKKDCSDPDCFGVGPCANTEPFIPTAGCGVNQPTLCCSDNIDGDLDDSLDCSDSDCDPFCTGICSEHPGQKCIIDTQCPDLVTGEKCSPTIFPWLESFLNDIYGKQGIQSAHEPPQSKFNATFCLISTNVQTIINYKSELCAAQTGASVNLPSGPGYTTALGKIDLAGITSGRFGQVTEFTGDQTDKPGSGSLSGGITVINGNLTINNPMTFANAFSGSGAGLVIVYGDLTVNADVSYQSGNVNDTKKLASAGWLVLKNAGGAGGNVVINPAVTEFSGIVFAAKSFTSGAGAQNLTVYGPIFTKQFNFGRTLADPNKGSETVIFDSRSVLNPPPGLSDVAKTLPNINMTTAF